MSKYINAEQLEKDGWTMQRTYKLSATEMVCETKKPTDIPSIDVADAGKIIDELNKVPWYSREDERQAVRIVKSFFATDSQSSVNENRSLCKLRHENGNCLCVGGFCTAVNDEICNAVRSAYDKGLTERQEVRHGRWKDTEFGWLCSICGQVVGGYTRHNYCPNCGSRMDLECEND